MLPVLDPLSLRFLSFYFSCQWKTCRSSEQSRAEASKRSSNAGKSCHFISVMSLGNITLSHINFTANCSNLAVGLDVWLNDFVFESPTPGNLTYDHGSQINSTADNGPTEEYFDFFTNGTSPEWLGFWRSALASALPASSIHHVSDQDISKWANTTDAFLFFDYLDIDPIKIPPDAVFADELTDLSFSSDLSQMLARQGGCKNKFEQKITDLVGMIEGCVTDYCCSSASNNTKSDTSKTPFPYYSNWTVADTCSFDTCRRANNGNPDIGGIGMIVAYITEGSILALTIIMYGLKKLTDYLFKRPDGIPKLLDSHNYAMRESSGVFLDTSVFFALSICFAAIVFKAPLLYENKLSQISTLLTIDTPVAILLLSYRWLERLTLRVFIVMLTALTTFVIQLLFRRSQSFNPANNLCLNWDSFVERVYRARFTVYVLRPSLYFTMFHLW